ncbi:MAG TPA: hypothetical protein VFS97_04185 [Nitrososphaeraceae archaeon]|nr:hypothetical protein [Nitrososphaeraceae archaeon]
MSSNRQIIAMEDNDILTIRIILPPAFNLVVPIVLYHKEQFKVENLHFYV